MLKGMYIAASGMTHQIQQLSEVTANLANVNTPGYKHVELVGESFDDSLMRVVGPTAYDQVGMGIRAAERVRHEGQGPLARTSNPLHLALSGEGYFTVQRPDGQVQLTRNGSFQLDNLGFLANAEGARVLDTNDRPIQLGAIAGTTLVVGQDGTVRAGVTPLARIKVVGQEEAGPSFPVGRLGAPARANGFSIQQGYLEGANVNVIAELVHLMDLNKIYGFSQKAISAQDNVLNKTVNELGRVG